MRKEIISIIVICTLSSLALSTISAKDSHATEKTTKYAWENVIDKLKKQRNQISTQLESARDALRARAHRENPNTLAQLFLEPPRQSGYQIIPTIQQDKPQAPVTPKQHIYSLKALSTRVKLTLHKVINFTKRVSAKPAQALTPLVREFERLRGQLHNLESNIAYHASWQRAVIASKAYFDQRNHIAATINEWQAAQASRSPVEHIAKLQSTVQRSVTEFSPTPGLSIKIQPNGMRVLSVVVYTDMTDKNFLKAFREGVMDAFTRSDAARRQRFAVNLDIRQVTTSELYSESAPARGTAINVKDHLARFPQGSLILTTGGESTHAWVGRNITLGPNPISRRTLAHEFGHLLGFSDAYLRSYEGDSQNPYGVVLVEWTGIVDNLMGSPDLGRVTEEMIETLIEAYGKRF